LNRLSPKKEKKKKGGFAPTSNPLYLSLRKFKPKTKNQKSLPLRDFGFPIPKEVLVFWVTSNPSL